MEIDVRKHKRNLGRKMTTVRKHSRSLANPNYNPKQRTPFKPTPGRRLIDYNWKQSKKRFPNMNPKGDIDGDGVKNSKDCKPFDKTRQGWVHDPKTGKDVFRLFSWQDPGEKVYPSERYGKDEETGEQYSRSGYYKKGATGRDTGHFGTGIYGYTTKRSALRGSYADFDDEGKTNKKLLKVDIEKPFIIKEKNKKVYGGSYDDSLSDKEILKQHREKYPNEKGLEIVREKGGGEFKDKYFKTVLYDEAHGTQDFHRALKNVQKVNKDTDDVDMLNLELEFRKQGIDVSNKELKKAKKEWEKTGVQPANIILEKRGYTGIAPENPDFSTGDYGGVNYIREPVSMGDFEEEPYDDKKLASVKSSSAAEVLSDWDWEDD